MRIFSLLLVTMGLLSLTGLASAQEEIRFDERTLTHDRRERRFLLYVPPGYRGDDAVPLVFVLHGGGGNPDIYERMTGFGEKARDEGFILVYPAGTGRLGNDRVLTWNAGHCCGYALERDMDDVGFFRRMVDGLTAEFNIDVDRIYVAGHSNGAMMAYRLAAEMPDVFAAAGIVAGTIGGYPTPESNDLYIIPQPENPVSVLHIHGMGDKSVRYSGGINDEEALSWHNDLSVAQSIAFWVEANQCSSPPAREPASNNMVIIETYDCNSTGTTVQLISIGDGGHSWPGGTIPARRSDPPNQRVSATDEIWTFFSEHPRP